MNLNQEILETKKAMGNKTDQERNWALETWLQYCNKEARRK